MLAKYRQHLLALSEDQVSDVGMRLHQQMVAKGQVVDPRQGAHFKVMAVSW